MIPLDRYREALAQLPDEIKAAEVTTRELDDVQLFIHSGKLQSSKAYKTSSVSVFASDGESVGSAVTECGDDDPAELIRRAYENSRYSGGARQLKKGATVRVAEDGEDVPFEKLLELGLKLEEEAAKTPSVSEVTSCSVRMRTISYHTIDTFGDDNTYSDTVFHAGIGIKAGGQGSGGYDVHAGHLDDIDPAFIIARALEDAKRVDTELPLVKVPSGISDVVINRNSVSAMMVIAWMAIHNRYHSANAQIYPLRPEAVIRTVQETPETWENGMRELPPPEEYEGGKWKMRLNGQGTAEMVSSPTMLYISSSEKTVDQLISDMGNGILVTDAADIIHSVEPSTGAFSLLSDGLVIENGKPVGRFEKIVVSGTMQQLMRGITETGDDLTVMEFMNPYYAYGGPSILAKDLKIAGNA